jgi:CheY-like chemotaxis protein
MMRETPTLWFLPPHARDGGKPAAGDGRGQDEDNDAPLKILIVEDEFFIALEAQAQIEDMGHAVVGIAVSADEAVALAARESPDVVLMDIRLAGPGDGIDAALRIRASAPADIVFVTANTDPATLGRARTADPLGVLQKPLTPERLREVLAARPRPDEKRS